MASRKRIWWGLLVVGLVGVNVWYRTRSHVEQRVHRGETMGSTFSVTWTEVASHPDVPGEVNALLAHLTDLMSTYDPKSQLSEFNRNASTDWVDVAPELAEVGAIAERASALSNGTFDITVKPLVALWGFGPDGARAAPTEAELSAAASHVGFRLLEVRQSPPALRKQHPELQVDLNGIAPGYAVDQIAALLARHGIRDYLIDVGGELRAAGHKPDRGKWRVAIEVPDTATAAVTSPTTTQVGATQVGAPQSSVGSASPTQVPDSVYDLEDTALATSGDYRNYYERDGKRLSHTIDPRTRRPIDHTLASVTVLAPTAAQADALATVLNVLGPDDAVTFANQHQLSALLLVRVAPQTFERRQTGWFVGK